MHPLLILSILVAYFLLLYLISRFTGQNADDNTFYRGNRQSAWYVVAFGMIGASLSGVTFISVPGWVGSSQFGYMQMVLGYVLGYFVIAQILLPLYYKLNLTSIYTYLEQRFGLYSYKTGSSLFLLSRLVGASFRLFLVASVLQYSIFDAYGIPFFFTVVVTIALIWLYTHRGGIKTIVWTDTLQTAFMLAAVFVAVISISKAMNLGFGEAISSIAKSDLSNIWNFSDVNSKSYFWKQFLSGAFITIVMTGLDQDMMQKNLTCRNLKEAKKNMYWYGIAFVPTNLLFLALGVLLYQYVAYLGINLPEKSDELFPMIATQGYTNAWLTVFFMLGLIAAAYSSADSALTSLTTVFTLDILDVHNKNYPKEKAVKIRQRSHLLISVVLGIVILIFDAINNDSVIDALFKVAGYTYGPLLGLYAFGLFTKRQVVDKAVPWISLAAPIACYILSSNSEDWLNGYKFGYELLIMNGTITFLSLLAFSKRKA